MKRRASIHLPSKGISRTINVWLAQHAQAFIFSLGQTTKNPMASFLTIAVIGVSLSLPAGFYLLLENATQITAGWKGSVQVTAFLKHELEEDKIPALLETLAKHEDIKNLKLISKEEALEEYRQHSGFSDALEMLDENPLPAVILIQPAQRLLASGKSDELLTYLENFQEIETSQFDRQWVKRLSAIIGVFQRAVVILSGLLAFAVLLIIGNTIRLSIYNRRSEIEINKLFGATNAFIQRPFLYSGLIHGFCGSIMAWLLLVIAIQLLEMPFLTLSGLYASDPHLTGLTIDKVLILLAIGAVLGLAGSWFAVKRHLQLINLT